MLVAGHCSARHTGTQFITVPTRLTPTSRSTWEFSRVPTSPRYECRRRSTEPQDDFGIFWVLYVHQTLIGLGTQRTLAPHETRQSSEDVSASLKLCCSAGTTLTPLERCYTGSILVKGTFFKEAFKHKGLRVPDQSVVDHEDALGGQQKSRTVIIIALPPTRPFSRVATVSDVCNSHGFSPRNMQYLGACSCPNMSQHVFAGVTK